MYQLGLHSAIRETEYNRTLYLNRLELPRTTRYVFTSRLLVADLSESRLTVDQLWVGLVLPSRIV